MPTNQGKQIFSITEFLGIKRNLDADKIADGGHVMLDGLKTRDKKLVGIRGRVKQNVNAITDFGKNGLFFYENSSGVRELIYTTASTVNVYPLNPMIKAFFSFSSAIQAGTGRGMEVDVNGKIYVIEENTTNIDVWDKAGTAGTSITVPESLKGDAIRVDDDGSIYLTASDRSSTHKLFKLDSTGTEVDQVTLSARTQYMAIRQGEIYVNDGIDVDVYDMDTLDANRTISGTSGDTLEDMEFGNDGFLYAIFDDTTNRGVKQFNVITDTVSELITTTTDIAGSIAVDEFNRIWVLFKPSAGTKSLRVYDREGNQLEEFMENAVDQTDFFFSDTAHIKAVENEIIIHDYNASNFKGIKVFLMRRK